MSLHTFPSGYHTELQVLLIFEAGIAIILISMATVGYRAFRAAQTNPVDVLQS